MTSSNASFVHEWLGDLLRLKSRRVVDNVVVDDLLDASSDLKWTIIGNVLSVYDVTWKTPGMPVLMGCKVVDLQKEKEKHCTINKTHQWPSKLDLSQIKRWLSQLGLSNVVPLDSVGSKHAAFLRLLKATIEEIEKRVTRKILLNNVHHLVEKSDDEGRRPKRALGDCTNKQRLRTLHCSTIKPDEVEGNLTLFEQMSPLPSSCKPQLLLDHFLSDGENGLLLHNRTVLEPLSPLPQRCGEECIDVFHDSESESTSVERCKSVVAQQRVDDAVVAEIRTPRRRQPQALEHQEHAFSMVSLELKDNFYSTPRPSQ